MATIVVDVAQVDSTGGQFLTKRGDLEGLVSQSKSLMANLQAVFKGQRADAILREWEAMQPNLQNAIQTLQQAGDLLKRAAAEFDAVDRAR